MSGPQARVDFDQFRETAPAAYAALAALSKAVDESGLDKALTELIKLRASQINGCAFCAQFHLNLACKLGVAAEKLDLVAVWKEAGVFSDRELAALACTELLTRLERQDVPDADYAAVLAQFSETEVLFLTIAIGTINSWNRIGVALRFSPQTTR